MMKFNIDGPVWRFIGTLTDFIILNFFFILTCIPVITIGPSLSALFTVTLKEARGEHGYMIRAYFKAFRANLKNSFLLFVIYAAAGAILLYSIVFWYQSGTVTGSVLTAVLCITAVLYLMSLSYIFALAARFENTVRQTIKNAVMISLSHLKSSVLLLLILTSTAALTFIWHTFAIFMLIFGFAFISYCQAFILTGVFKTYEIQEVTL